MKLAVKEAGIFKSVAKRTCGIALRRTYFKLGQIFAQCKKFWAT